MDADPAAVQALDRRWKIQTGAFAALLERMDEWACAQTPESQIYWRALSEFDRWRTDTERALLFQHLAGESALTKALEDREAILLKACERGTAAHLPAEPSGGGASQHAFFADQCPGVLPILDKVTQSPAKKSGGVRCPRGRPDGHPTGKRSALYGAALRGNGIAHIGSTEQELGYDYLTFPADTAYYFENTGTTPLKSNTSAWRNNETPTPFFPR